MTTDQVAAALYAFSDLMDDAPEVTGPIVRDELSFVVARYGMTAIEFAANRLAARDGSSPVQDFLSAIVRRLDRALSHDRLDWCHKQVNLAFGGEGT